jgi:hypothetical protein
VLPFALLDLILSFSLSFLLTTPRLNTNFFPLLNPRSCVCVCVASCVVFDTLSLFLHSFTTAAGLLHQTISQLLHHRILQTLQPRHSLVTSPASIFNEQVFLFILNSSHLSLLFGPFQLAGSQTTNTLRSHQFI